MRRKGFTLIELLVVMLIIGILFSFVTAAVRKSLHYTKDRQTTSDQRTLEAACRAYRHEYGKWPIPAGKGDPVSGRVLCAGDENAQVVELLLRDNNQKKITFVNLGDYVRNLTNDVILSPSSGKPFTFVFDLDEDSCSVSNVPK